jgi:hypothetical protein
MIDAEIYNRQESRLRMLGIGLLIGFAGMFVILSWLR